MFSRIGAYFTGEEEVETEEQRYNRERRQAKLRLLSENQRRVLLDSLKNSINDFMKMVADAQNSAGKTATMESTDDAKTLVLNDDMEIVSKVCENIDRCCCHGLRHVEGEDETFVKFFGLLKWTCARLTTLHQRRMAEGTDEAGSGRFSKEACQLATSSLAPKLSRDIRGFVTCVRAANSLGNVNLDEGKARAFIRQALNTHLLRSCLREVLNPQNEDLLTSYYTEYALFRHFDDAELFISLLDGIDDLPFGFLIDDKRLDMCPDNHPFSQPLPKPLPQPFTKAPAKLIDPEDMIEGRVRLSSYDTDSSMLAEKLVSHRHLGENYDAPSGGNPLADILRKTRASQALDDAATAVFRYLEIGLPEYEVFGAPLLDVVCNPFLCGMARFETSMGIPDVVEACICYLHRKLSTPGLFQVHIAPEHVMDLRDAIEEIGGFHKSMAVDPHEVVAILLQYLWEIPEPLLTEERWEAFVSCGKLTDPDQRLRNLKLLLNDLPWSHKPILDRLIHLCGRALEPEFSKRSGIDVHTLAMLLSPILLRDVRQFRYSDLDEATFRRFPIVGHTPIRQRLPASFYGEYDSIVAERVAVEARALKRAKEQAEEGALILETLIENQAVVMSDFRKELARRRSMLRFKVERMEKVRKQLETPIDLSNSDHVALLKKLWDGLLPVEEETVLDWSDNNDPSVVDVHALMSSKRWKASGFHTKDPMGGFRGGGLLSLECLASFVTEYPAKAKIMMERNAVPGGTRYPFPVAAINVLRMMVKLLMLDEEPEKASRLILHSETGVDTVLKMHVSERVSRTPFWRVFDDEKAFEKLHAMAFMLLDLHWTRSGATQMGFNPVLDATRRQMGWLLEQAPRSVEDMWKEWMKVREQHATKFTVPAADNIEGGNHTEELAQQMMETLRIQEDRERRRRNNKLEQLPEEPETASISSSSSPAKEDILDWESSPSIVES